MSQSCLTSFYAIPIVKISYILSFVLTIFYIIYIYLHGHYNCCVFYWKFKDLGQPNVTVLSVTATSISLSWSVPNTTAVDSYEVMWQRDTSGECSDEDEGSTTITDGSTDYTIEGLEEDSTYMVTVTAVYSIGNANSNMTVVTTSEAGMYWLILQLRGHDNSNVSSSFSSICCSHFCKGI